MPGSESEGTGNNLGERTKWGKPVRRQRKYLKMSKKATMYDIAVKLGITASTVSRALSDHPRISAATKKRVLQTAREYNYQPNHIAAALRMGKSKLIGVVVPTANRNFFSSVV